MTRALPALVTSVVILYAIAILATRGGVITALAALVVAALLWRRHRRARFAAYIFLTAVVLRSALTGRFVEASVAVLAIALLQVPVARQVWPRLRPGRGRAADGGDTMSRP